MQEIVELKVRGANFPAKVMKNFFNVEYYLFYRPLSVIFSDVDIN